MTDDVEIIDEDPDVDTSEERKKMVLEVMEEMLKQIRYLYRPLSPTLLGDLLETYNKKKIKINPRKRWISSM